MKRSLLLGRSVLLLGLFLTGCGSNASSGSVTSPEKVSLSTQREETSSPDEVSSATEEAVYDATVKKDDGTPLMVNVQWCTATACLRPVLTDTNGYALAKGAKDGETYYVHVASDVKGYTYDANNYVSDQNHRHVDIVMEKILEINDDTITKAGVYVAKFTSDALSLSYTLTLPKGEYEIESWNDYGINSMTKELDPSLSLYEGETLVGEDSDSGFEKNFRYSLSLSEEKTYTLTLSSSGSMDMPFKISSLA